MYTGEIISISVALSWTITALCFEYGGKRIGALSLNIIRLGMSVIMLGITLWVCTGYFLPVAAGAKAWFWLGVSGFIGYVLGDYCLFNSYLLIGSRFGQLFMTLAPPSAAIASFLIFGEKMSGFALLGMFITLFGIGLSVFAKGEEKADKWKLKLPLKGVLLGIGAGVGQGVGLVFSKLGMEYYIQDADPQSGLESFLIPFASTQIRGIIGVTGFLIVMMYTRKGKALLQSFRDGRAMIAATGGTIFGPFLGGILLPDGCPIY
ncbi:MAG: DMT family transporter [Tannerellaceae bacterium]|nr:DMT family transporter [Tannerellaceae bacterium]